jgi:MFS family permease
MATVVANSTGRQEAVTLRSMLPIISASTLGTAIEWYDFFLYGFLAATVFPGLFFPTLEPSVAIVVSFTTNFVGFAARPLGGAFFGWFGDRIGRTSTLAATLLLMGIATVLMGILPGYATIGMAAPILLAVLRFLQGAGVGGEWGGSVLLSMEYGDHRRGFWASWPQTGVPIGLALAALTVLLFKALYPGAAFDSIGWRIPFLQSSMLIMVALYIRLRIPETPAFARVKDEKKESRVPLLDVVRYHWHEVLLSALLRSGEQAPLYIFATFVLTYGAQVLKIETTLIYIGVTVSGAVGLISTPLVCALSDRIGRKLWFLVGIVVMGGFTFPYFWLLTTKNPVLVITAVAISLGICHAWLYGPEAALISERFGTRVRYTGASLGYQLASITAGGPAPLIATYLLANYNNRNFLGGIAATYPGYTLIAWYMISMVVISFIALLPLREYAGKASAGDGV